MDNRLRELEASFPKGGVGGNWGDEAVINVAVWLSNHPLVTEIREDFQIEIGAVINNYGEIVEIVTHYDFDDVGSHASRGESFWHTHPTNNGVSGDDMLLAKEDKAWTFAIMPNGEISAYNGQDIKISDSANIYELRTEYTIVNGELKESGRRP